MLDLDNLTHQQSDFSADFVYTYQSDVASDYWHFLNNSLGYGYPSCSTTVGLTSPASATTQVGQSYSQTNVGSGGAAPYTYSLAFFSQPPAGTTLNTATGTVSGTPTTAGVFGYVIQVADSEYPPQTAMNVVSGTIAPATLVLTSTASSTTQVGQSYSQTNVGSGGTTPYTYSLSAGTLPAGTTLDTSTGTVSGTPNTTGAFNYTIEVTDSGSPVQDRDASQQRYDRRHSANSDGGEPERRPAGGRYLGDDHRHELDRSECGGVRRHRGDPIHRQQRDQDHRDFTGRIGRDRRRDGDVRERNERDECGRSLHLCVAAHDAAGAQARWLARQRQRRAGRVGVAIRRRQYRDRRRISG
jgi:hypothetical protein